MYSIRIWIISGVHNNNYLCTIRTQIISTVTLFDLAKKYTGPNPARPRAGRFTKIKKIMWGKKIMPLTVDFLWFQSFCINFQYKLLNIACIFMYKVYSVVTALPILTLQNYLRIPCIQQLQHFSMELIAICL